MSASHSTTPDANQQVAANYQYWRDFGHEWAAEYDARKLTQPLYHLQELMLTDYIARCGALRVLELGCGPGRHLRNLSQLPGVDVYGFDQSEGMVSGCLTWTSPEWIARHVATGLPASRLPYPDQHFDVSYTSEALLHSRPEDLESILREMLRVTRGHILHIEPPPSLLLESQTHVGCWSHDLVSAYNRLGHTCEILPAGYICHTPFRVNLASPGPSPAWPPHILALYRRLEIDLLAGLKLGQDARAEAQQQCEALRGEIAAVKARNNEINDALRTRSAEFEQALAAAGEQARRMQAEILSVRQAAADEIQQVLAASGEQARRMEAEILSLRAAADAAETRLAELERVLMDERAAAARQENAWRSEAAALGLRVRRERDRVASLLLAHEELTRRIDAVVGGH